MTALLIDEGKCSMCGMCVEECPAMIIQIVKKESPPSWIEGAEPRCINCGHCVAICPNGALGLSTMPAEDCAPITKDLKTTPEQIEQFLKSRRSTRLYKDKPVEREKLAKLIDIARYAPSGHNSQPVQWLVFENKEDVRNIAQMVIDWMRALLEKDPAMAGRLGAPGLVGGWDAGLDLICRNAPHLMVATTPQESALMGDGHIALTYLELAAYSMDIGACWAGFVQAGLMMNPPMAKELQIPEGHISNGALMIGYPKYRYSYIPMRNEPVIDWR